MPKKTAVWAKMGITMFMFHLVFLVVFFWQGGTGAHIQFMVPAHMNGEIPIVFVSVPSPAPKVNSSNVIPPPTPKQSTCSIQEKKAEPKAKKEVVAKKSDTKEPVKKPAQPKEVVAKVSKKEIPKAQKQKNEKPGEPIAIELSKDARHLADEYQQLYTLLQEQWAPPAGVESCSCVVECTVDWDGVIQKLQIKESSGMLMFDLAARNTIAQLALPNWTKGKSIAITFVA